MIIRNARPQDAVGMSAVDRLSWPAELAGDEQQFLARIAAFPEGQWVGESENGRIVGVICAQRISTDFLRAHGDDFEALTDHGRFTDSHDPTGEIYQLTGVGVVPEYRGQQLGRVLVDRQIEFAATLPGVKRIIGITRPVRYHRFRNLPIEDYVRRRIDTGRLLDPVLSFHMDCGARLVSIHPQFRPQDSAACGYGVLIEYPCHSNTVGTPTGSSALN